MYERFTDRARKVMQLANQEAQRFNHEYIGTEHILLGLVKEGSGVAANVTVNDNGAGHLETKVAYGYPTQPHPPRAHGQFDHRRWLPHRRAEHDRDAHARH